MELTTSQGQLTSTALVVACGGLSMPKLGATPFGYQLAEQFGHTILPVRAGLVPLLCMTPINNSMRSFLG